ncbi:MAG: hypothetical protein ACRD29_03885 [Acidimicrobiales bacterium]
MKRHRLRTALVRGALVIPLAVAVGDAAPADADQPRWRVEYEITELDSLGGTSSAGNSINNRGWVGGTSREPVENAVRATLWRDGSPTDLGTLGGPNSAILWPAKNSQGIVVGVTETADVDPLDEAWSCSVFFGVDTDRACVGFVWERDEMQPLPTFGGTHGFATGVNNRGHVVGWAEVSDRDSTCNQTDQFLGFLGALWDTRRDRMHELPPLPGGDTASAAVAINDRGQVVGISGDCSNAVGGFSARHAVMWEDGEVTDIGDLGGEAWNTPMAINQWGVVVGFANQAGTPGDDFNEEAFLWTERGGIRPLGMLDGDVRSEALGVNNWGLVVGLSRGAAGDTAVIWRHAIWGGDDIVDLNTLAPDYDGHLDYAGDINDAGVITGQAISATGEPVAFVATPRWRFDAGGR